MARDQQFCLRWNNYQTNLAQVFEQLLHSEVFVDVTLACEGNSIKAHRMMLSACSPYFQNVLAETPCSHPVIILQGVKWLDLKAVVEFIYKGEINVAQDQLASLLHVAESLKIRGLADVGGEEAEAVLTSPSESPRNSNFWGESNSRKRRRLSGDDSSPARSRSPISPARPLTPLSATEVLETSIDIPSNLSRGSSSSLPPSSLPSPSPVASLASSLSSLAHLHGPMPPPGPPLPPHLAHLPPLSPLSPLLNMHHPMTRHHSPEDFEIRPGIAEMIREEERRRRDMPDMAKLLESTHHWIGNPMADSYQAQVQAAWQKSWNQTQSLLQNLRFRERGPLKSWRPETMAEAIHAVLKEGLSLSQAARKYDIPYPTFVLYANRVHNLLGPSHEPGDMRPKGRGRPQRILLGSWPEDQIKGVIRAVVFRDTTVFRDGDHKENKQPPTTTPQPKEESSASLPNGPITPNSNVNSSGTSEGSTPTPLPASTPSTSQASHPGEPTPNSSAVISSDDQCTSPLIRPKQEPHNGETPNTCSTPASAPSTSASPISNPKTTSPSGSTCSGVPVGPQTPQSRPSSASSNSQHNGPISQALPHANSNSATVKMNGPSPIPRPLISPASTNGLPAMNSQISVPQMQTSPHQQHLSKSQSLGPNNPLQQNQVPPGLHNHQSHQHSSAQLHNQQQHQRGHHPSLFPQHPQGQQTNQQHSRAPQPGLPPMTGPQQMLGLIAGGIPPASLPTSPAHMARLFGEGQHPLQHRPPHAQPPINTFHPGYPRAAAHPAMQPMGMLNPMNPIAPRLNADDSQLSPEAILFGKLASATDRLPFNSENAAPRQNINNHNQFDNSGDSAAPQTAERSLLFRDGIDGIKSEPEAIMN